MMRIARGIAYRLRVRAPKLMALVEGELPLRSVSHLYSPAPQSGHQIPNIFYQTWLEPRLGRTHSKVLTKMREANQDYGFEFFDEAAIERYMAEAYRGTEIGKIFSKSHFGPMRTDIWRYCVLYDRGGVYCDIGKGFTAPLREIIPADATGVISYETNAFERDDAEFKPLPDVQFPALRVINWALAFAPRHPLLKRVIDGIVAKYPIYAGRVSANVKLDILNFTGPIHLTECVHAHAASNGMGDVYQAGVDFGGRGQPTLPGSLVRYVSLPSYVTARDQTIVD